MPVLMMETPFCCCEVFFFVVVLSKRGKNVKRTPVPNPQVRAGDGRRGDKTQEEIKAILLLLEPLELRSSVSTSRLRTEPAPPG